MRQYRAVLADVRQDLQGLGPALAEHWGQGFLQRLLFLQFVEQGESLRQRFEPHRRRPEMCSFAEQVLPAIPVLRSGLFDEVLGPLPVRNATVAGIFDRLLLAFTFMAEEEATDGVTPEMLGQVFESVVLHGAAADLDGVAPHRRKATGSYYTPRAVVRLVCREVLRQRVGPDGVVRCCDPAVGCGAFAVGMLHELGHQPAWLGRTRVEIARESLFGIDLQPAAVEICRLRLWLAGARDVGVLRRNFRSGDSLLESVAPEFDVVIGNPPFVTARSRAQRERYRARWPEVCVRKFHLLCPFLALGFGLLRPGGQLGYVVSNAFATRAFGRPLVETFLPGVELRKVIDCSGLLFPGHGTPTYLLFGANRPPDPALPVRVALTRPGGGDLRTTAAESPLWQTLVQRHDQPGYADERVVVADLPRTELERWPWNLDRATARTAERLRSAATVRLRTVLDDDVGFMFVTGRNEIFVHTAAAARRLGLRPALLRPLQGGEDVRNWELRGRDYVLFPYEARTLELIRFRANDAERRYLARFETELAGRPTFAGTFREAGRAAYEFHQLPVRRAQNPRSLAFAELASHAHFVFDDQGQAFNQKAPLLKLSPAATDADHHLLSALLNSSAVLFLLKQDCYNRGAGAAEGRDRFEYAGGKVERLPVPELIVRALRGEHHPVTDALTRLAAECRQRGRELAALALARVFEREGEAYHSWYAALPGHVGRHPELGPPWTSAGALRAVLRHAIARREQLQAEMIARQEEIDWLVYAAFGLSAEPRIVLPDGELALAREQRPFCLWAEARGDFARAMALLPGGWSADRWELWKQRLALLRDDEHLSRIEQPLYKRRWDEQWKFGSRWACGAAAYDAELTAAFADWLADKAEWWLERRGQTVTLEAWTAALAADPRVAAAWEVVREAPGGALAQFFAVLVRGQSVPAGIPFGVAWEELARTIRVPRAVRVLRGARNVPRERFWQDGQGAYCVARPMSSSGGS